MSDKPVVLINILCLFFSPTILVLYFVCPSSARPYSLTRLCPALITDFAPQPSASECPHLYLDTRRTHFIMLNVEKELFEAYAFYTAITVLKMVIMSFLTARQRFKTMTFISSEDAKQPGTKVCGVGTQL